MVDDFAKIVGVAIHGQDVGDFAEIFVGELVGTCRAKSRARADWAAARVLAPKIKSCRCAFRGRLSVE